jgi:hypothetical protein
MVFQADGELAFGVEREFRLGGDEAFVRGVDRARAWGHLRNVMDVDGGVLLGGEGRGKRSGSRAGEQLQGVTTIHGWLAASGELAKAAIRR